MEYKYRIADLTILLHTNYELIENAESTLFRKENDATEDISCRMMITNNIPKPEGCYRGKALNTCLYESDSKMYLETFDRKDDKVMILSCIEKQDVENVYIWALSSKLPHTARMQVLWAAMDLPYLMLRKNVLTMHSSVIEVNNAVILFFAPSGTGKSTQAELWNKYRGSRQLNGDKTAVSGKKDYAVAYGLPFCGTSGICTDFHLPVRAMVLLSQEKENRIIRLTGIAALRAVVDNCFGHQRVEGCMDKMIEIAMSILETTPIYSLACTPDEKAVICLEEQLRKDNRYGDFVLSVD